MLIQRFERHYWRVKYPIGEAHHIAKGVDH